MKITLTTANTISSLLEELDEYFPKEIPINNAITIEDFRRLQGHQEVIQYIRNLIRPDEEEE